MLLGRLYSSKRLRGISYRSLTFCSREDVFLLFQVLDAAMCPPVGRHAITGTKVLIFSCSKAVFQENCRLLHRNAPPRVPRMPPYGNSLAQLYQIAPGRALRVRSIGQDKTGQGLPLEPVPNAEAGSVLQRHKYCPFRVLRREHLADAHGLSPEMAGCAHGAAQRGFCIPDVHACPQCTWQL